MALESKRSRDAEYSWTTENNFLVIKAQATVGPVAVLLGLKNGEMKPFSPLVTFIISRSI